MCPSAFDVFAPPRCPDCGALLQYELWPDTGYEQDNYRIYYCPSCEWSEEQEWERNVIRIHDLRL